MQKDLSAMGKEELLAHRKEVKKQIGKYKNLQMAKKVSLNSLYGAL